MNTLIGRKVLFNVLEFDKNNFRNEEVQKTGTFQGLSHNDHGLVLCEKKLLIIQLHKLEFLSE